MRLVIVSNRLPITITQEADQISFKQSIGGLATGLSSYLASESIHPSIDDYLWVGWPGNGVEVKDREHIRQEAAKGFKCYPVFLSKAEVEEYYLGFCNQSLWPLFHGFRDKVRVTRQWWKKYQTANIKFCRELSKILKPGDCIWIHDYHLMLLPKLIKEGFPHLSVGFFLHIPFPKPKIFTALPVNCQKQLLEGVLKADLIGFHTPGYSANFSACLSKVLGTDMPNTSILSSPMGIDFDKFAKAVKVKAVDRAKARLARDLGNGKIILSADRLDYTKGITQKLKGYKLFLQDNPNWRQKVTLQLCVAPSREEIPLYQQSKAEIERLVGKINRRFATPNWQPVVYRYQELSFYPLIAHYLTGDAILVTPLSCGMNLMVKEYLASRTNHTGVVILSSKAGAACELKEALFVDPKSPRQISQAILKALNMPTGGQRQSNRRMRRILKKNSVTAWANGFLSELLQAQRKEQYPFPPTPLHSYFRY